MCWSSLRLESHKPAPTFEKQTLKWRPRGAGHPVPACGWSWGRMGETQETAAHARSTLGTRAAQVSPALLWLDRRAPPAPKGQLDLNPSHPPQPSLKLWLPLFLELRLRRCIGLGFHFWSIICTIYPLN